MYHCNVTLILVINNTTILLSFLYSPSILLFLFTSVYNNINVFNLILIFIFKDKLIVLMRDIFRKKNSSNLDIGLYLRTKSFSLRWLIIYIAIIFHLICLYCLSWKDKREIKYSIYLESKVVYRTKETDYTTLLYFQDM
jgi:hypothetical protein